MPNVPKEIVQVLPDPRVERFGKAVAHIKKQAANRPSTEEELRKVLITHFKNKLQEVQLNELLSDLRTQGVIAIANKKLTYRAK